MILVVLGTLLLVMKFAEFGPVAAWPWWLVLAPFGLAILWWWFADASGWTKRREMDRMDKRKEKRRRGALEGLGLDYRETGRSKRRAERFHSQRQREIEKVEGKRTEIREKNRESILGSRFDSEHGHTLPGDTKPKR